MVKLLEEEGWPVFFFRGNPFGPGNTLYLFWLGALR